MKITLQEPFTTKWKIGYIVTNKENRKHVILYNNPKDRSTISFARYQLSCFLKQFLPKNLQVDHIDGDKTNDSLLNLQLLTAKENHNKQFKIGETLHTFICPVCKKTFTLTARQSHKKSPTCSKTCGGIKSHWK